MNINLIIYREDILSTSIFFTFVGIWQFGLVISYIIIITIIYYSQLVWAFYDQINFKQ